MKKFIQFQDWIGRMYPEFSEKSEDKRYSGAKPFTFQVTDACNLACTYCYQINKGVRRMPFETAKLAVDKLLSGEDGFADYIGIENSTGIILEFIGGEPFLEIELIDRIVDYFRERAIELNHPWAEKFCVSLCSNGVLYSDPKVQAFLQKNSQVVSFSVTVDGTKELHDACRVFPDGRPSYDVAHAAAMDWMARGYYMGSKITIAPGNVKFVAESLKQMVKDGYHEINANTVFEKGWEIPHAQELYRQIKEFSVWMGDRKEDYAVSLVNYEHTGRPLPESENKNWCGGTGLMLAMDPDGKLYPCLRYMESSLGSYREPIVIGDVWNGLGKRECEQKCIQCMNCIDRRTQSTDECYYCPIAAGCAWCSAYNYQENGTADKRVTYSCDMHKARCLGIVEYWNSYAKLTGKDTVKDLWVPREWAVPIVGEEEYDRLVELTKSLGGSVNEDKVRIEGYQEVEDERGSY